MRRIPISVQTAVRSGRLRARRGSPRHADPRRRRDGRGRKRPHFGGEALPARSSPHEAPVPSLWPPRLSHESSPYSRASPKQLLNERNALRVGSAWRKRSRERPRRSRTWNHREVVIRPRSGRAWLAIAARLVAVVLWAIAIGAFHRPVVASLLVATGVALFLLTLRPRAAPAPGALYTAAADRIADGRRLPGQLSLTTRTLVWSPSPYSARRGEEAITVDASGCRAVSLQRGSGLLDVILTVVLADDAALTFGTHSSRRLTRALDRFRADDRASS